MILDLVALWLACAAICTLGWSFICAGRLRWAVPLGLAWPLYPIVVIFAVAERLRVPSRP